MQIDHALILCAGLGTRMGEIGTRLPKALWPIYFKSLLELQIDYCRQLGVPRIFINTHFLAKEIESFISSNSKFSQVVLLHEDPLLGSGGAIHNLASRGDVNYTGNLLLVNADQFMLFDPSYFKIALDGLASARAALFGIRADRDAHYNETVLANDVLIEIKKPSGDTGYTTYSGLGLLRLDNLSPMPGVTKFFETVANYKKECVRFVVPTEYEYWDFGTADVYFENIKKISCMMKDKYAQDSLILKFLKEHGALTGDEKAFFNEGLNSIDLFAQGNFQENSIVGMGLAQKIDP